MGILLGIIGIIFFIKAIQKNSKTNSLAKEIESRKNQLNFEQQRLNIREESILKKEKNIKALDTKVTDLTKSIADLKVQYQDIINEIEGKYDESLLATYPSVILSNIEDISSTEIKNQLSLLKLKEKEFILNNAITHPSYLSTREINTLKKKMLTLLDSEINGLLNMLTLSNIDSSRNKIIKTFDKINRLFKSEDAGLNKGLLELKLQELELNYSYIVKLNDEKEQQKAIKEQMLEEEKVRREIDREKKRIEKEERQFNTEITKLMSYMQKANTDVEKELYADKIRELELKLSDLETIKENVLQREINTRAGYVYIISNIGSFGENIYKIGMTRRLEPMDRIKELSSASVPFEFDVHAMIFSEDAPKLENQLHIHFRKNEVNKVNQRKEFFNVSIKEIEQVVLNNYNGTVTFTKLAKAEQYRRSLELSAAI